MEISSNNKQHLFRDTISYPEDGRKNLILSNRYGSFAGSVAIWVSRGFELYTPQAITGTKIGGSDLKSGPNWQVAMEYGS